MLKYRVAEAWFPVSLCPPLSVSFSIRRGVQGVMKRWGFAGGPSDERGATKFHRRPGCIGSGRDKGRVWPGQKLPGHVGGNFIRMKGIRILRINYEEDILYLHTSCLPGELVRICDIPHKCHFLIRFVFLPQGEFVYLFDTKLVSK